MTNMGDDKKWKRRLPSRIYNYNYNVSEGYYKPQFEFMETKQYDSRTTKAPPHHLSYAERFAKRPWYGGTTGLPYNEGQTAGPLIKLADRQWRSSSLLREMKELEDEGVPLSMRLSRRKKKIEEDNDLLGIRQRANRNISLDDNKYTRSKDFLTQINQKILNLDNELTKSTVTTSTYDHPTKWNYNLDRPGRQMRHTEESYSSPYTGSSMKTISHSSYSQNSSRPPIIPSRTRKVSDSSEDFFKPQSRIRVNSVGSYSSFPRSSHRSIEDDEDVAPYSSRVPRLKEERRVRESHDFTDDVMQRVDLMRMRSVDVDPLVEYSQGRRTSRSSSVDRTPRRRGSTSRYVYGIGKI